MRASPLLVPSGAGWRFSLLTGLHSWTLSTPVVRFQSVCIDYQNAVIRLVPEHVECSMRSCVDPCQLLETRQRDCAQNNCYTSLLPGCLAGLEASLSAPSPGSAAAPP